MLSYFLTWWMTQMRALLLGEGAGIRAPDGLIVAIDDLAGEAPRGMLLLRRQGREAPLRPLGAALPGATAAMPVAALPRLPVILRLPAGLVLSRQASLPLAAARDLQTMLAFEMDRLTPFTAAEVYWSLGTVETHRAQEKVSIRLLLVLRRKVDGLLAHLRAQGLAPRWIEGPGGLIALDERGGGRRLPRLGQPLAWLCLLLGLLVIGTPFIRQEMALAAARQALARSSAAGEEGAALLRRIAIAHDSRLIIGAARDHGDALALLAALTTALPDGTWLDDLSLHDGALSIDGESTDATRLIALLSAVPLLRAPSFAAPVTRSADDKMDQFSLRAAIAP
ncbi:PilN domain-containing protein [Acidisoma sp. C75]